MSLSRWNQKKIFVDKLPHAIIVEAGPLVDKLSFAKDIVKAYVCKEKPGEGCDFCIDCRKVDDGNYEDMYIVDKGNDTIKKEDVESIQEFIKRKAQNICIICNADKLIVQSQNKLLKTLEEPSKGSHIILLSENVENFLDTVKSRCVIFRLSSDEVVDEKDLSLAKQVIEALLEDGYFHQIKTLGLKDKEEILALLDGMEKVFRDYLFDYESQGRLYRKEDIFRYIKLIEEAKKDIRYNVNPISAFKKLVLKIGG
ncbi:MAG: hypothetical protein MJ146_03175 [Clostridia bacterium]|nr:hypothetical protein [Clostridia bacterium]